MNAVSIFIPAKNEGDYIGEIISDLKQQTFSGSIDLVVYDANSSDETRSIVTDQGIVTRAGGPINEARNLGMKGADNELVLMFDADVRIAPDFVERAVREFNSRDIDIATAWNTPYLLNKAIWYKWLLITVGWWVAQVYQWVKQFSETPRLTSTFVILTKSAWKKTGGFDEDIYRGGDTDFVLRAVGAGLTYRFLRTVSVSVSARKAVNIGVLKYFLITMRMNAALNTTKLDRKTYEKITRDKNYFQNK